jgi:hypothetical protein
MKGLSSTGHLEDLKISRDLKISQYPDTSALISRVVKTTMVSSMTDNDDWAEVEEEEEEKETPFMGLQTAAVIDGHSDPVDGKPRLFKVVV